jgi:hypothetical protein
MSPASGATRKAGVLLVEAITILMTRDWLDPNWRHQQSNAVIAWLVVGALTTIPTIAGSLSVGKVDLS